MEEKLSLVYLSLGYVHMTVFDAVLAAVSMLNPFHVKKK